MTAERRRDLTEPLNAIHKAEEEIDKLRLLLHIAECRLASVYRCLEISEHHSTTAFDRYREANQRLLDTTRQKMELERQNAELRAKLDGKTQDMDRFICSICYKRPVNTTTCCHHVFCRECIHDWMRSQALVDDRNHYFEFIDDTHAEEVRTFLCPICKKKVRDNEVSPLYFLGEFTSFSDD
jgi:hypothetical protein